MNKEEALQWIIKNYIDGPNNEFEFCLGPEKFGNGDRGYIVSNSTLLSKEEQSVFFKADLACIGFVAAQRYHRLVWWPYFRDGEQPDYPYPFNHPDGPASWFYEASMKQSHAAILEIAKKIAGFGITKSQYDVFVRKAAIIRLPALLNSARHRLEDAEKHMLQRQLQLRDLEDVVRILNKGK